MVLTFGEAKTPAQILEVAARSVLSLGTLVKCLLHPSARNNPEVARLRAAVIQLREVFQGWCKNGCNCRVMITTAKQDMIELTSHLLELAGKLIPTMTSHQHVKENAAQVHAALATIA